MTEFTITITNGEETVAFLDKLQAMLISEQPTLFRSLGDQFVSDVKRRIITSDDGTWAPASKWLRAKTGQSKVLLGAERYVRLRTYESGMDVFDKGGKWTLTQHHEGFTNQLADDSEPRDEHGRVIIKLKDPNPLNLYQELRKRRDGSVTPRQSVFAFVPLHPGVTPPRKIWDSAEEVKVKAEPTVSRWLAKVVAEAGGALVT